jgi:mannosyltransferase
VTHSQSGPDVQRVRSILIAILFLAALLRVLALDKPLYIDEIVTITVGVQPLDRMGSVMRQIDASPALYPLLLHAWMKVARSDAWVRGLSALLSVLTVGAVFLLGRRCFSPQAGLAAAFIMAIGPAHIHYAQYVRGYSLLSCLITTQVLVFIICMKAERSGSRLWGWFMALSLLTVAAFYAHYLSALLMIPEGLYGTWCVWHRRYLLVPWAAAMVCAGMLFLPGVPLLAHNIEFDRIRNEQRAEPPSTLTVLPNLLSELSVGQRLLGFSNPNLRRATLAAAAILFPLLTLIGLKAGWQHNRSETVLMALISFLPMAIYIGTGRRLIAVRFFVPFMAGYVVLLGQGLASLGPPARRAALVALVLTCGIPLQHFYRQYAWSYDHRAIAAAMAAQLEPRDALLFVHPYEALYYRWYLGSAVAMKGLTFTALEDQPGYVIKPGTLRLEQAQSSVIVAARAHDRLWLVGQSPRSFASDAATQRELVAWMRSTFGQPVLDLGSVTGRDPEILVFKVR